MISPKGVEGRMLHGNTTKYEEIATKAELSNLFDKGQSVHLGLLGS